MHPMLIDVHAQLRKIFDAAGEKYRIPTTCGNCKKWRTARCEERKQSGRDSSESDWCRGYKGGGDG